MHVLHLAGNVLAAAAAAASQRPPASNFGRFQLINREERSEMSESGLD